jgi:GTP-binding protein LepA
MIRDRIRNFSIVAHIDHGKTTLSDRLLERTGAVSQRDLEEQMLDSMELEKERGITIKAHYVRLTYKAKNGQTYYLNLIDTPGHVDFSYEVSRSLAACEGALLVVDATQGVEAQTLANAYLAIENDLTIIPVINKIDLPSAEVEKTEEQIENVVGVPADEAILVSAKTGEGTEDILEALVERVPPPEGDEKKPLKALVFDSWYNPYRGVVLLIKVIEGRIKVKDKIKLMFSGSEYNVEELGYFTPKEEKVKEIMAGDTGYLIAEIKKISDVTVGDTITLVHNPADKPLPGFKKLKPMVFAGFYPADKTTHEELADALNKLSLNDSSFEFEPENSPALGLGYRCGFLGLLHREIIQERLEREFNLTIITTAPSVRYRVKLVDETYIEIDSPAKLPEKSQYITIEEPFMKVSLFTPQKYVGTLMKFLETKRAIYKTMEYISAQRVILIYEIPFSEMVVDFYDKIKLLTSGYASFDYEFIGFKESPLERLEILINNESVDALSLIVSKDTAYRKARELLLKLRKNIPKQLFEVILQSKIGGRIIARETIKALRKNVLAKCYGGDITRKRKLLEKQKEGKRRMKKIGRIEVPQEAFLSILKSD